MQPPQASERAPLWFGPGARLEELAALLSALGSEPSGGLDEAGDLCELDGAPVLLVWDADTLAQEELGFLRRHVARSRGGSLVLVGDDVTRRGVRSLLRDARVRFLPWPPDVDDLRALVEHSGAAVATTAPSAAASARSAPERSRIEPDDELAEIESILSGGESARLAANAPTDEAESLAGAPEAPAPAPLGSAVRLDPPPAYFKDQVADLADIAQRIQLSLDAAQTDDGEAFQHVGQEVERLVQFTRTLGYLVSPPSPGTQSFDLSEMVDVFLAGAPRTPESPRLLFRGGGALPVRSDRALLSQALDAFLFLAQSCATKGEIVRLQTRAEGEICVLTIQFPPGPLAEIEPEQILQPYGLRRTIPKLGPNALAAATGIIAGQGGRALLERNGQGRLGWRIELPRAPGRG
ncbi:MAG: hypothetical protein IPJ19_13120 [Planctomycetes bacterium]|nr:hypothetical protein [Planctomycetota bacterium]